MVRKCGVQGCLSDSNRPEDVGVTFHKVPMHPDIRPKWLSLCRIRDEKKACKVIYVCSRHFLRADFCNFKGKKYMLKQGVLPSVFPWDKSKLEAIKAEIKKEVSAPKEGSKLETESDTAATDKIKTEPKEFVDIKEEVGELCEPKQEPYPEMFLADMSLDSSITQQASTIEPVAKSAETNYGRINFVIDSQIEALDFNNTWYPAKIAEVDYEENEVLIHFETFSSNYDEWICMDSPRLRPLQQSSAGSHTSSEINSNKESEFDESVDKIKPQGDQFVVGERCLASWSDARKFPGIVTKVLKNDTYEILFDDGYVKIQKANKMLKVAKHVQSSPLFDPIQSTKQERRDKKRKLNVAALFKKRPRLTGENELKQKPSSPSAQSKQSPTHSKQTPQQPKQTSVVQNKNSSKLTPTPTSSKQNIKPHSRAHRKSDTPKTISKSSLNKSQLGDASITQDLAAGPSRSSPSANKDKWLPQWVKGVPVGILTTLDTQDGPRKSVIVPDPRIPEGWVKHVVQRPHGVSAGKWDTVIVGPDAKRFRTKSDIRVYLEANRQLNLDESMFEFRLHRQKLKQAKPAAKETDKQKITPENAPDLLTLPVSTPTLQIKEEQIPEIKEEEIDQDQDLPPLKILHVDDAYKCPIEGCGKNFRKENLAQMHVKHYHPEYTKFLDSTPNVADLAYARTVGDSLDRSPGPIRTPPSRPAPKTAAPKASSSMGKGPQSPLIDSDIKPLSPQSSQSKIIKDTEIIKLLNTKPFEPLQEPDHHSPTLPVGPASHPDIKLRDLLTKSEGIPKVDDMAMKNLSSTRPTGIKTLLPVRPPEADLAQDPESTRKSHSSKSSSRHGVKRKKVTDSLEPVREREKEATEGVELPPQEPTPAPTEQPTHIIEGGKVIKIVRMKQEEIINCTCGYAEEDGLMIQCELCLCWQHAYCNNIEQESQVPEKYVCFICQNPARQRPSRKYYHDQDWLKLGVLPTASYHSKDEVTLQKKFDELRKAHDISGGLVELQDYVHSLSVKLKIAEDKDHPKLYLWSEPWERLPLPEKIEAEEEKVKQEQEPSSADQACGKTDVDPSSQPHDNQNDSMLMMILKDAKEESKLDINTLIDNNQVQAPIIPQPEAAIDSAVCRVNLLEHISHSQNLVEERLDDFEKRIETLEEDLSVQEGEDYPKTRQTMQMLLRDLKRLEEFSMLSSI